jgi:hypothetical protein
MAVKKAESRTKAQKQDIRVNTDVKTKAQESRPRSSSSVATRIVVKYNCGYPNTLYIRGKGSKLSWDKGVALKNVKDDEWVFETNEPFTTLEFKFLINDHVYELGDNHRLTKSGSFHFIPKF